MKVCGKDHAIKLGAYVKVILKWILVNELVYLPNGLKLLKTVFKTQ
jgi:hypothetical protein